MFSSILWLSLWVLNIHGVMSDTTVAEVSCNGGSLIGSACIVPNVYESSFGFLEVRLISGTGCDAGMYSLNLVHTNVYLFVKQGCSGKFSINKLEPPAYNGGCGVNVEKAAGFRIIGGQRSPACQYPWMTFVTNSAKSCGGFIIDKDHVITASQCLRTTSGAPLTTDSMVVHTGNPHKVKGIARYVEKVFYHPDFDANYLKNDIAILRLNESIKFDSCHSPLCVGEDTSFVGDGTTCRIMGWGKVAESVTSYTPWYYGNTNFLQWSHETIVSDTECKTNFPAAYPDKSVFCSRADETAFCSGDGGSPMVCLDGDRYFAYGIISARKNTTCTNTPGLLTSVPFYYDWIEKTIDSP